MAAVSNAEAVAAEVRNAPPPPPSYMDEDDSAPSAESGFAFTLLAGGAKWAAQEGGAPRGAGAPRTERGVFSDTAAGVVNPGAVVIARQGYLAVLDGGRRRTRQLC